MTVKNNNQEKDTYFQGITYNSTFNLIDKDIPFLKLTSEMEKNFLSKLKDTDYFVIPKIQKLRENSILDNLLELEKIIIDHNISDDNINEIICGFRMKNSQELMHILKLSCYSPLTNAIIEIKIISSLFYNKKILVSTENMPSVVLLISKLPFWIELLCFVLIWAVNNKKISDENIMFIFEKNIELIKKIYTGLPEIKDKTKISTEEIIGLNKSINDFILNDESINNISIFYNINSISEEKINYLISLIISNPKISFIALTNKVDVNQYANEKKHISDFIKLCDEIINCDEIAENLLLKYSDENDIVDLDSDEYKECQKKCGEFVLPQWRPFFNVFKRAIQAGESDVTPNVLITGATGAGKEVIAQIVHNNSKNRRNNNNPPMFAFNAAGITETIAESELFGIASDSGIANSSKKGSIGLIQQANDSTLFIDEIGDMPLTVQTKLLRVIQDRKVRRSRGVIYEDVKFMLVSATNKDLEHEIKNNKFREDFYYRINGFRIHIPELNKSFWEIDLEKYCVFFINQINSDYLIFIDNIIRDINSIIKENGFIKGNIRALAKIIEQKIIDIYEPILKKCNSDITLKDYLIYKRL
ncbi:MAG TPA: sigma 54-interacting transcriptional regulator, partial [bacterium]|nr:sigma 54-interacting transcriptional regulator [bacterium]